MIIASGRTFEHRDLLRSMGGRFDKDRRAWTFGRLTESEQSTLRGLVGVTVAITSEPMPVDDDDGREPLSFAALIADIVAGKGKRKDRGTPSVLYGDDPTYHNRFADKNPSAFFGFSTLGRFVRYIEMLAPSQASDDRRSGWETGIGAWQGTDTMAQAMKLARDGWPDGVARALDAMERLAVANPRTRQRRAAVAGGTVNVGRMLSGDPAHMVRRPKMPGSKVVTFYVETGCNGNITAESCIMRAALIGATVDLMENAGYSCTIVATDTSTERGYAIYQLAVVLKEAGEPLNLSDLMFALGHPSFLRRFSFAACSSVPETRSIWGTQGSASNAFDDDHRCGPTEFYVPVLSVNQKENDCLELLDVVTPSNLPITIAKDHK